MGLDTTVIIMAIITDMAITMVTLMLQRTSIALSRSV